MSHEEFSKALDDLTLTPTMRTAIGLRASDAIDGSNRIYTASTSLLRDDHTPMEGTRNSECLREERSPVTLRIVTDYDSS